ncbi:type II secretion system minor pseudopilin GspK [Limnohabitans lacus]|uniref:Type II secretion system protein K n=1 Tax=Limnohabitans lacus TaxID=3045173 RepID=A0ABT6X752_9BURK|nr:type II secretion system minor pseudopilin GspK [Limnohabitans sp. HM2-2]MDI9233823.1 type II secretion system minor pseudopilin GspK [Limnohabitans sp. HM2-2]
MRHQKGAALLVAMLVMALVATLASAALWQQWRQVEIESAERGRSQTGWMLTGALDWSRLILLEDAKSQQSGNADHLGEPWALPVQESKLSTFLSQDQKWQEGDAEVFLSGYITDAQSRLNLRNLMDQGTLSLPDLAAWRRLFEQLGLPLEELNTMVRLLPLALTSNNTPDATPSSTAPLMPQLTAQLVWLGMSSQTVAALENFVTVLPEPTTINLNTAPAEVLMACLPGLDMVSARQLLTQRQRAHWTNLQDVRQILGPLGTLLNNNRHGVQSSFFEINGRMRIDQVMQQERALVKREGSNAVRMLWRVRTPLLMPSAPLQ